MSARKQLLQNVSSARGRSRCLEEVSLSNRFADMPDISSIIHNYFIIKTSSVSCMNAWKRLLQMVVNERNVPSFDGMRNVQFRFLHCESSSLLDGFFLFVKYCSARLDLL